MTRALKRDPIVRAGLFATLAVIAFYLLRFARLIPKGPFDVFDFYIAEPLFLAAIVALLFIGSGRVDNPAERRFWKWLGAGFACWLAASLFLIVFPDVQETTRASLALDSLYLVMYLLVALSIEAGPHLGSRGNQRGPEHRIESIGAILFVFGLLGYFVLIPSEVNAEAYETWIPSFYLYIALDLFVAARFANAARAARSPRWKAVLSLLSAMAVVWIFADAMEALLFADVVGYETYMTVSAFGFVFYFLVLVARRYPSEATEPAGPPDEAPGLPAPARARLLGALVIYAYLFPLIHFTFYGLDLLDGASRGARELLVAGALMLMGILTVVQHVWLDARNRRLQRELDRASIELQRSQRLEAIGRLAGGVAHDFNNLLTVIRGSSDTTLCRVEDPEQVRRHLNTVRKASDQASGLTRQLLALGSRQFLEPELVDVNEIIVEAEEVIRGGLGPQVEYSTNLAPDLGPVMVDLSQFNQVLLNLAMNARDAMPGGGRFIIESRSREVGLPTGRRGVVVTASDTGTGMDPSTLEQAFDPFFSTKQGTPGRGLGLATVYGIVKQSGGKIRVESRPGKGTLFTLDFPVADLALPATRDARPAARSADEFTVLLVDDDDDVRELVEELLSLEGYRVLPARDGGRALEICESHSGSIHLLLTDIVMPRMSGAELADRVRLCRPETAILYMSGYVDDPESRIRLAAESGSLIKKPFSAELILGKVGRAVRRTG